MSAAGCVSNANALAADTRERSLCDERSAFRFRSQPRFQNDRTGSAPAFPAAGRELPPLCSLHRSDPVLMAIIPKQLVSKR